MTLPASGNPLSFSQVNVELGYSSTAQISMNCTAFRTLFGVSSGAIGMSSGFGKSNTSVPGAPTGVSGSATSCSAISVTFSAPACTGNLTIDSYTVTSSGSQTATGSGSPITVSGLSASTGYTFRVKAHNSKGFGACSSASGTITTQGVRGSAVYSSPGTYSVAIPSGVTSISAITVGAGATGTQVSLFQGGIQLGGAGGSGGGLVWTNNLKSHCGSNPGGQSWTAKVGTTDGTTKFYGSYSTQVAGNSYLQDKDGYVSIGGGGGRSKSCGYYYADSNLGGNVCYWGYGQPGACNNYISGYSSCRGGSKGGQGQMAFNQGYAQRTGGGGAAGGYYMQYYNRFCSYSQSYVLEQGIWGGSGAGHSGNNVCGSWNGGSCSATSLGNVVGRAGRYGGGGGGGGGWNTGGWGASGGGGGTGLYGQGSAGSGGYSSYNNDIGYGGGGGSGACSGSNGIHGAVYCAYYNSYPTGCRGGAGGWPGGGAGSSAGGTGSYRGAGASGGVRIIWPGSTRRFPSTDVA